MYVCNLGTIFPSRVAEGTLLFSWLFDYLGMLWLCGVEAHALMCTEREKDAIKMNEVSVKTNEVSVKAHF